MMHGQNHIKNTYFVFNISIIRTTLYRSLCLFWVFRSRSVSTSCMSG